MRKHYGHWSLPHHRYRRSRRLGCYGLDGGKAVSRLRHHRCRRQARTLAARRTAKTVLKGQVGAW